MKRITVLLAEDHEIVRKGLRSLLEAEGDIEVIGEARSGREAVRLAKKLLPEVVVMDIGLPVLNGVQATRQILMAVPATRVLILSAYSDDEYIEQVITLGAVGYLLKHTSAFALAKAIREAHKGNTFFGPSISRRFKNKARSSPSAGRALRKANLRLTSRELEVLQLIAEGSANKQCAAELGISIKTVEKHRQHLMSKLDIHDTAGLTRYAIATGIIESGVQLIIE